VIICTLAKLSRSSPSVSERVQETLKIVLDAANKSDILKRKLKNNRFLIIMMRCLHA